MRELVKLFGRFHDNPMVTQEAVKMAGLEEKSRTGIHDDAHDAFMTLVSHTINKEAGEHLARCRVKKKESPSCSI